MAAKAETRAERLKAGLEELASSLGVRVSYEKIKKGSGRQPTGGLCYVHGEPRIIVHRPLPDSDKVQVLVEALRSFDLENLYIPPEIREALEGASKLLK